MSGLTPYHDENLSFPRKRESKFLVLPGFPLARE